MIQTADAVKNKINQSVNVQIGIGATLDINCNTLVEFSDDDFTGANYYSSPEGSQPFKLLFPIDSIVKPFRPEKYGIKYGIFGDVGQWTYNNPRATRYKVQVSPNASKDALYRTYCPSKNLYYKYYVTQKNANADLTIRYYNSSESISKKNKSVPANKIVLKFELSHCTPTSWSIFINGTDVTTSLTKSISSEGVVSIYYNGTTWTTNELDLSYTSQVSINTIRVTATNPGNNSYIGIIEVAPHLIRDLTDRLVSFGIQKEASSQIQDILPVGDATANSLEMELNSYGNSNILFKSYMPEESVAINNNYIYMVKKSEIKPYYKIYDAAGTSTDLTGNYFKVPQGVYYLDNWKITETGEVNLFALDAAKFLQEIVCPDILCDDYSATAVLRRILDSVGFTTYNFNLADEDYSVASFGWWWSDGTKTVWAVIQEICSDIQMSAIFDENNILQFYSRDYVFKKKLTLEHDWTYRNAVDGLNLPNIVSLESDFLPASNNIKVIYNSAYVAGYEQSNKSLADLDKTSLAAAFLIEDLPSSSGANSYMSIEPIPGSFKPDEVKTREVLQSYSGYLLINEEIIEYDAIEYEYNAIDGSGRKTALITSQSDFLKYRGEAQVLDSQIAFMPTNRYRIKTRGAFGTKIPDIHRKTPDGVPHGWTGYQDGILTSSIVTGSNYGAGTSGYPNDLTELVYLPSYGVFKRLPV